MPVFRSRADANLTAKIYARAPVLIEEHPESQGGDVNPWGITFQAMFHMSGDSSLFGTPQQLVERGWTRDGTDWAREVDGAVELRVPLYEAKMIHHFDHRWRTYDVSSVENEEVARDATLAEKQDPSFEPSPRYWVPETEVKLRAARIPSALKRAFRETDGDRCLKTLAEWLAGWFAEEEGRAAAEADLTRTLGRRAWPAILGKTPERFLREPRTLANGTDMQRETPLTADDLHFLADGPDDLLSLVAALIERKQPRWLMGWRDICRSTDERTVIASVFPKVGAGDKILLLYSNRTESEQAALLGLLSSLALDFIARQKFGGTSFKYYYMKQLAVVPPSTFTSADLAFITPRVLELTYTSHAMRPWAEDLGHAGPPFAWDEERRALLRAELDALFARKYGLTRDELRYVLDPADVKGPDYPSETFRVLKAKEEARYGEYRTRRLVLAAFDKMTGAG